MVDFYGKCIGKYTNPMESMGNITPPHLLGFLGKQMFAIDVVSILLRGEKMNFHSHGPLALYVAADCGLIRLANKALYHKRNKHTVLRHQTRLLSLKISQDIRYHHHLNL